MEQFLYQDLPVEQRESRLEAISEGVETKEYAVFLSPEEQQSRQAELSRLIMQEERIADEKKEIVDEFKDRLKPVVSARKDLIGELKNGSRIEEGKVFKVLDEENKQVGFYNNRGQLVQQRPMTYDDRQLSIKHAVNH